MTDEVEELADQVSQTLADVKAKTIEKSTQ
jgi:hypothetical protein